MKILVHIALALGTSATAFAVAQAEIEAKPSSYGYLKIVGGASVSVYRCKNKDHGMKVSNCDLEKVTDVGAGTPVRLAVGAYALEIIRYADYEKYSDRRNHTSTYRYPGDFKPSLIEIASGAIVEEKLKPIQLRLPSGLKKASTSVDLIRDLRDKTTRSLIQSLYLKEVVNGPAFEDKPLARICQSRRVAMVVDQGGQKKTELDLRVKGLASELCDVLAKGDAGETLMSFFAFDEVHPLRFARMQLSLDDIAKTWASIDAHWTDFQFETLVERFVFYKGFSGKGWDTESLTESFWGWKEVRYALRWRQPSGSDDDRDWQISYVLSDENGRSIK